MKSFSMKAFTTIELLVIVVALIIFGTGSVMVWKGKVAPSVSPTPTPTSPETTSPTLVPGLGIEGEVQTETLCSRKSGIDTCPIGYICYWSWECPKGIQDCGLPTGDFLCHKNCQTDSDCPSSMPFCKELSLFRGDVGEHYRMCMR